jgi:hypothetical protein
VINKAAAVAREAADKNLRKYYVLMIITVMPYSLYSSYHFIIGFHVHFAVDGFNALCRLSFLVFHYQDGVITDLQESINSLVQASSSPLSVLIVGVGGADFTEMEVGSCTVISRVNSAKISFSL